MNLKSISETTTETEENMDRSDNFPKCSCGKPVHIFSTAMGQGFCSDEHMAIAKGEVQPVPVRTYEGHGNYTKESAQ